MKKFLAAALALTMTAAVFTACGDSDSSSSSSKAESSSAAESSSVAEVSSAAEESSAAESSSAAEESSAAEGEAEGEGPVDISEAAKQLKYLDDALVTFTADTDPKTLVKDMAECFGAIRRDAAYVEAGKKEDGSAYTEDDFNAYWKDKGELKGIDATYGSDYVKKVVAGDTDGLIYIDGLESRCNYEIEEVAGVPMLKVSILDLKDPEDPESGYDLPKIQFKLNEIFKGHEDLLPKVNTVKMDAIARAVGDFTADDGTSAHVPGLFMGAIAIQALEDDGKTFKPWDQQEFSANEWTSEWLYCDITSKELLVWNQQVLSNTTEEQYATIMRWSIPNDACFYIADIAFYDIDGNPIKF